MREGIARILEGAGLEVVAEVGRADEFLLRAMAHRPDEAVVDIQMPPDNTDDGLRVALSSATSARRLESSSSHSSSNRHTRST